MLFSSCGQPNGYTYGNYVYSMSSCNSGLPIGQIGYLGNIYSTQPGCYGQIIGQIHNPWNWSK
jgi:hypothetical protein